MSSRVKDFRIKNKISKRQLSESSGIAIRTITSWEKENSIIPSFDSLSILSKHLGCSLSEIAEMFLNDSYDSDYENNDFFEFNDHSLDYRINPFMLPEYILKNALTGASTVFLNDRTCTFDTVFISNNSDIISFNESHGIIRNEPIIVLIDRSFNTFIINMSHVQDYKVLGESDNSIYISFSVGERLEGLTETDYSDNTLINYNILFTSINGKNPFVNNKYYKIDDEKKEMIFGQFIKDIRKKNSWTQNELCELLNAIYSRRPGKKLSVKTISKWETGQLHVPVLAFNLICKLGDADFDYALECYQNHFYSSDAINPKVSIATGLLYFANSVIDKQSFIHFIHQYNDFNKVVWGYKHDTIGTLSGDRFSAKTAKVRRIAVDGFNVKITIDDGSIIILESITSARCNHQNQNLVFPFTIKTITNNTEESFELQLAII